MTNLRKLTALSATVAFVVAGSLAFAQDDLDDLLKDLESETTAETAAPAASAPAEQTASEPLSTSPSATVEESAPAEEAPATEEKTAAEPTTETVTTKPIQEVSSVVEADDSEEKPAEESAADEKDAEAEENGAGVAEASNEEPAEEVKAPAEEKVSAAEEAVSAPSELETAADETAEEKSAAEETVKTDVQPKESKLDSQAQVIADAHEMEKLRRQAYNQQAMREIEEARKCMRSEFYADARRHYEIAEKLLNDSQSHEKLRRECRQGIADGLYRDAIQEDRMGRRDRAIDLMEKAKDYRHPKARRQLEDWLKEGNVNESKTDYSSISHRRNDEEYKAKREKNRAHLRRARQLLSSREIDQALDECEIVLVNDPYNQEALRLRNAIQKKRQVILNQEFDITRRAMIADVTKAWRPVYAPNARELDEFAATTLKRPVNEDPERTQEQQIVQRMREIRLPTISFKPPATIIDAVEWFRGASKDFDHPDIPVEKRGFNFVLKTKETLHSQAAADPNAEDDGGFASDNESDQPQSQAGIPVIPMITASDVTFYDALKLVCDAVNFKFKVQGPIVMVMPKDMSTDEMITRSYPVVAAFLERMGSASEDMKTMKAGGFGSNNNSSSSDEGGENNERDWKEFFSLMGVEWPEGSSILYIKTIGKLRVKNTYENLAELEKALTELNVDQKLIEIEARFVEVCQEDLNSLGFEWILNSDYNLNLGNKLGKWLGVSGAAYQTTSEGGTTVNETHSSTSTKNDGGVYTVTQDTTTKSYVDGATTSTKWTKGGYDRNVGVSAFGGTSDYSNGNRYLSTVGNHISGSEASNNDQFMRLNAYLGTADLSMILHMLSQRSDTDLLSAPKVLTRPGEEAVIKVVTEYIYPTDYDVQLQSSSSSGSSSSGSSQSAILAVVEPQSFTMREVGVILAATPTLTDDGNLIDLKLDTKVVDEPTWKNYGMKIPFTGNSSMQSFEGIGEIFTGLSEALTTIGANLTESAKQAFTENLMDSATAAMGNLTSKDNITYYDAPMEQPFFHVRSIVSSVSIYPGATIVMGGLITEQRKAMDDKVPFLGDLPFIGRLFRSHAEQTTKRNLLVFVTTRLVDTRGREVTLGSNDSKESTTEVKAAPAAAE
jgi:general secretion pathway protein D